MVLSKLFDTSCNISFLNWLYSLLMLEKNIYLMWSNTNESQLFGLIAIIWKQHWCPVMHKILFFGENISNTYNIWC